MRMTPSRTMLATLTAASVFAAACSRPPRLAADLVITRARIWTGRSAQPSAAAVAVIGDRIVDVGGADQIEHWRGPGTTVLDAGGRRLVPGFNDAHARFAAGGIALDEVDLRGAGSAAEFARRINERAKDPMIKGLRPMLQDIADTYWILRDDVKPALHAMAETELCFDALI